MSGPELLERDESLRNGATRTGAGGGAAYPRSRGKRVGGHCKKWWWLYLLILVCLIVLIVCLVLFVAVPKMIQSRINAAKLNIQGITITQTQSQNFTMAINSTIEADSSIHAVIDSFSGNMYLEDWAPQTPFVSVKFPQTTSASETAVNITQFTDILDLNAFTVFNQWLLTNSSLNVSVEGNTHVKISGISHKYPVHFKKTLNIAGLESFSGFSVPNSSVSTSADAQGDNFFGTVIIPNRSLVSFEIGNVSFATYLLGENVGTTYIDDVTLYPGNNSFPLRGNVSTGPVLTEIQERPYCEDGMLLFVLQGSNVTNHGEYLSYYANSLSTINETVSLNISADLAAIGLTVTCPSTTTTSTKKRFWLDSW
ncbi:hypothetical protein BD289DRAFT_371512 [Coniella lustricola]|uniref:Uncharacterized protein n=1 Tax=Coniella lustricola TaxID=2025994 RepID=A0A2T3A3M4_9PEZI|nr:hypothetical protein BD289DRAFT_371512 [Coniella lustricola]